MGSAVGGTNEGMKGPVAGGVTPKGSGEKEGAGDPARLPRGTPSPLYGRYNVNRSCLPFSFWSSYLGVTTARMDD